MSVYREIKREHVEEKIIRRRGILPHIRWLSAKESAC